MAAMTCRVAAIDCGTNSIRLLISDIDPVVGRATDVVPRRMEIVRLGQGVDRTGELAAEALDRTFAACVAYAKEIDAVGGVSRRRFVATSATRDARNREVFVAGVRDILGVEPDVVSGDEEAMFSFVGATRELDDTGAPYLVVDIGGGSTELVLGAQAPEHAVSVDMGCVRLTERYLRSDPPTLDEVAAARAEVERLIDQASESVPLPQASTVVGLAGSVTTVAGIALGLPDYDPVAIHRSRIAAADVHAISERLLAAPRIERAAIPVMHPGRVDVIAAGALVLDEVLRRVGSPDVLVSEHDILDGIAWSLI
jgi:exopolyphosphatase/guanosine-5'-triphosphate,3'-diphosphate pyrophosphatase